MSDPAQAGWQSEMPDNPSRPGGVLTAALLAGSFFFITAGDYAMPDREIEYISKWQPIYCDIVPVPKATLSPAIRASMFEKDWPAIDFLKPVETGSSYWEEQIAPKGLDKWRGTYPDVVPARFHKELSPAIQAGSSFFVDYSQSAGNWNANPLKAGLVPADFMVQSREQLPRWTQDIKKNYLNTSIQAGSFAHVNFRDNATKLWNEGAGSLRWFPVMPDILRSPVGLSAPIMAGSFFHANFVNTIKTWVEDVIKESWRPKYDDIVPAAKQGLSQAVQGGPFTQPPFMPLAINYKNVFVDQYEARNQDQFPNRHHEVKKTLPSSIQAGSFFNVEPSLYPAKTWAIDITKMGWDWDYPDIIPMLPKGLIAAILAGHSSFVGYGDHGSWNEDIDPSNWYPVYQDRMVPSIRLSYCHDLSFVEQNGNSWAASPSSGLPPNTFLVDIDGGESLYLGNKTIMDI